MDRFKARCLNRASPHITFDTEPKARQARVAGCRPQEHCRAMRAQGFLFSPDRDAVARRAGQRSPSEKTWALVLEKLTMKSEARLVRAA